MTSNVATVTLTRCSTVAAGLSPVANNDAYTVQGRHGTLTVAARGVCWATTPIPTATSLTAVLGGSPAENGSLTLNADGSFTYTSRTPTTSAPTPSPIPGEQRHARAVH